MKYFPLTSLLTIGCSKNGLLSIYNNHDSTSLSLETSLQLNSTLCYDFDVNSNESLAVVCCDYGELHFVALNSTRVTYLRGNYQIYQSHCKGIAFSDLTHILTNSYYGITLITISSELDVT